MTATTDHKPPQDGQCWRCLTRDDTVSRLSVKLANGEMTQSLPICRECAGYLRVKGLVLRVPEGRAA
jgi:hypothetical protein